MTLVDVDSIRSRHLKTYIQTYTERDVIIYALGIGCTAQRFVYENDPNFAPLPSFAVVPAFGVLDIIPYAHYLPKFDSANLLHGEHYLELLGPLPVHGRMHTKPVVLDIQNKGTSALVAIGCTTVDALTNQKIAYNEFTTFIRKTGKFETSGSSSNSRNPAALTTYKAPSRAPDISITEHTSKLQATLYRLSGDSNPLHVDPEFAKAGGFPRPILHGLCTMGFSVKHILEAFAGGDPTVVKSIKVRFVKHVFPGETLRTDMWLEAGHRVVFQTVVVERNEVAISNAAVVLQPEKVQQRSRL